MLADFLLELQSLGDSLEASREKAAPESAAVQSDDKSGEVLTISAHNSAALQPAPLGKAADADDRVLPVRDIRALLRDDALPLTGKREKDESHGRKSLYRTRALLWAGVLFVLVCLIGALYRADPFGFTARWKRVTPHAPSTVGSMPASSGSPAGPIDKIVPALPTPPPATSPGLQPPTPAARRAPAGPAIGVSYRTATAQLGKAFAMKKVSRLEGQERYVGQTDDRTATLEIIGNEDDVSEVRFVAGLPADDPGAAERNGGFAFSFIQNIEPEWTDAPNWIADNLANLSNSETEYVEIVRGDRRIRLRWIKASATMSISVRHKGREEPITEQRKP